MSDPDRAAEDPIFWLHHSNIDRLWHVWNRSNPSRDKDPTDPRWRTHTFSFLRRPRSTVQKTGADVVDVRVQLGYVYEEVPGPVGRAQPARRRAGAHAAGGDGDHRARAAALGAGAWDGRSISVTFRPFGLIPPDRPDLAHALPEERSSSDPAVTIGRVSVSYA
jgi:hypothetical protein